MATLSEESRHAATVVQYMELCADLPSSLRKMIANSKAYHDLVLSLAQEASVKNVATLKEAHRKCAEAWEKVLEEKRAEKKRKALEEDANPTKRTKTCEDRFASRASSPTNAQTATHIVEPVASDTSLIVSEKSTLVTESASAIAPTTQATEKLTTADTTLIVSEKSTSVTESASAIAPTTQATEKLTTADITSLVISHNSNAIDIVTRKKQTVVGVQKAGLRGIEALFPLPGLHLGLQKSPFLSANPTVSSGSADSHTIPEGSLVIHSDGLLHSNFVPPKDATVSALMSVQDMKHFKEFGITTGNPDILGPIKVHCMKFTGYKKNQINDVLSVFCKLNFDIAKLKLLGYLNARPESVDAASAAAPIPQTWDMDDSFDIVKALQIITKNDEHSKLHRIYAQMRLYDKVTAGAALGFIRAKGSGKHIAEHLIFIERLAKFKAGQQLETAVDSIEKRYTDAYFAGKRWRELVGWFGGVGIVFIFVARKIGISYMESGWNKFHFDCLEYIAGFLPSIKKLVRTMGSGVLEQYCRNGNLSKERVNEIRGVKGYC